MFPDRSREVKIHSQRARELTAAGRYDDARACYLKWVESARQMNVAMKGGYEKEWRAAQQEYSEFAGKDPLYRSICEAVIPLVRENPAILQTEVYKKLPRFGRSQLSYGLYFAAEHGLIKREKKGRSYALTVV